MKQKIEPSFPRSSIKFTFSIDGVFAFPDEWRTTDEANPGILGYVARTSSIEIANGKVFARQLTEKQKLEEESKKKGGKKQSKQPENAKTQEQIEQQQAQERRKEEEWNKLSEDEKFYASNEDPFKSATLRFDEKSKEVELSGKEFMIFEEHALKDGGDWIYFYKLPIINEEQLGKLKKSKPKNLNLNDLNPVTTRAWVDLSSLCSGSRQVNLRCQLQQVDQTEDTPTPNLEKTYIKIQIKLQNQLVSKKDEYNTSTIIKEPPQPEPIPAQIKCVDDMKQQFRIALQSLAMQYSLMFWKELNFNEEQKQSQIFGGTKKNDHTKRKEQFLYDFNVSGKYKILKERIKRTIVSLCEHKYRDKMDGEKSFTGISCSVKDQFYSEIYNFLVSSYSEVMEELVKEKKQILGEVQVPNEKTQKQKTKAILEEYKQETKAQNLKRILAEYELIGNQGYGETVYKKAMEETPDDHELGFKYALFCIQNKLKTVNEVLSYIQAYLQHNKTDKQAQLIFILLMIASENEENLMKGWIILRSLIQEDSENTDLLCYAHLTLNGLGNTEAAAKYQHLAERAQLRKLGKLEKGGNHKESPIPSEIPSLNGPAAFSEALQSSEQNSLWLNILKNFIKIGLLGITNKIKEKLTDEDNIEWKKIELKTLLFEKKYEECAEKANQLYAKNKEYEVLEILLCALENLPQNDKTQNYLKLSLKVCPKEKKAQILFKLGHFYLKVGKYGNAQACIIKYLDGNSNYGGLSWRLLGFALYKSGQSQKAIECLRHANLSDPYDGSVWGFLALCYADLENLIMVNQCMNSYEKFSKVEEERIKQIVEILSKKEAEEFYDESLRKQLLVRLSG